MKTFICNSVLLPNVPEEHRACNGCFQYTVLVRAKTKKRVAELLRCSYNMLHNFYGCCEATANHMSIPQKDETIYYLVEHAKDGWVNKWFEYTPKG